LYHIDFYYVKLFWLERRDYIVVVLDESKKMYYSLDAVERKKMIALSWVNSSVICFSGCYGSDSDEIDKKSSVRHLL